VAGSDATRRPEGLWELALLGVATVPGSTIRRARLGDGLTSPSPTSASRPPLDWRMLGLALPPGEADDTGQTA
jgi:hypothetical protein